MKNSSIISAFVGAGFTAISGIGLGIAWPISIPIGVAAFGASELLFSKSKSLRVSNKNLYDTLQEAKMQNQEIYNMIRRVEPVKLKQNIREITETTTKIIQTVEQKPDKIKKVDTFFDYYLPVTLKILNRYDEIENQRLTTAESTKFMAQTEKMIQEINQAFKKQLANMYQSDIIDTDAEMKVFESMLKADGYDSENGDFSNINNNGGK